MEKAHTCVDGTIITYRLPGVIECLELQAKVGWGEEQSGFLTLAKVLKEAEQFIVKVEGEKKSWKDCVADRKLKNDLTTIALSLVRDEPEAEEKKS